MSGLLKVEIHQINCTNHFDVYDCSWIMDWNCFFIVLFSLHKENDIAHLIWLPLRETERETGLITICGVSSFQVTNKWINYLSASASSVTHMHLPLLSLQQCCSLTGPTNQPGRPAPARSSCGTSCSSCWGVVRAGPSVGKGNGASSLSGTRRGLPGCGGRGRASRTWTTTSSAGRSGDAKCTSSTATLTKGTISSSLECSTAQFTALPLGMCCK